MKHHASPAFWKCYLALPLKVQALADKNFQLLKVNEKHPSLHLKKVGVYWSLRVGLKYRAIAVDSGDGAIVWFWIGNHTEYDRLVT